MASTAHEQSGIGAAVIPGPHRWLLASGVRGRLVIAAVFLQAALPFVAFLGEPPTRFGFQMYSGLGHASVQAQSASGEPIRLELSDLVAGSMRPDMDWTRILPEHVCANVPGVATVTVSQSSKHRDLTCR